MNTAQIFIIALCGLVATALECYDCDPPSSGNCLHPEIDDARVTLCGDVDANDMPMCFSIYYKSGDEKDASGIYRGCLSVRGTQLPCDYLEKQLTGGNVTFCKMCAENRCNIARVNV